MSSAKKVFGNHPITAKNATKENIIFNKDASCSTLCTIPLTECVNYRDDRIRPFALLTPHGLLFIVTHFQTDSLNIAACRLWTPDQYEHHLYHCSLNCWKQDDYFVYYTLVPGVTEAIHCFIWYTPFLMLSDKSDFP